MWRRCAPSTMSYRASTLLLGKFTQVHPITVSTDSSGSKVILTGKPWGPISPGAPAFPMPPCGWTPQLKKNCSLNNSTQQHGLEVLAGIERIINTWSLYQLEWRHRRSTFAPGMPGIPSRPSTPGKPWSNTSTQQRRGLFWGLRMDFSLN